LSHDTFYKLNLSRLLKKPELIRAISTATDILEELAPLNPLAGAIP